MYPIVTIAGREVYTMWLVSVAGLLAALCFVLARRRRFGVAQVDVTNAGALGLAGAVVGGKALYLVTAAPILWRARAALLAQPQLLWPVLVSGTVFYGGLFGFLLAAQGYCRRYRLDTRAFWDLYAPAIPLFHAFGRVGCFLNGCCHGIVSERFGVAFPHAAGSASGVPYLPVQLFEAAGNAVLFLALAHFSARCAGQGRALRAYLAAYAVMRFALEFLRGDAVRGVWWGLSTSQWISLGVLAVLCARRVRCARRRSG